MSAIITFQRWNCVRWARAWPWTASTALPRLCSGADCIWYTHPIQSRSVRRYEQGARYTAVRITGGGREKQINTRRTERSQSTIFLVTADHLQIDHRSSTDRSKSSRSSKPTSQSSRSLAHRSKSSTSSTFRSKSIDSKPSTDKSQSSRSSKHRSQSSTSSISCSCRHGMLCTNCSRHDTHPTRHTCARAQETHHRLHQANLAYLNRAHHVTHRTTQKKDREGAKVTTSTNVNPYPR